MIYLHDDHIRDIGIGWRKLVDRVETVTKIMDQGDCVQPLKPYLRFRDPRNRIIAMPAFVGGEVEAAGLKWIAGFPENWRCGLPRAHNVTILNDPMTGRPVALCASSLLSVLRTAAVSGMMIKAFSVCRNPDTFRIGIIGWGPIGRSHLDMCISLLGERIERIILYDIKGVEPESIPVSVSDKTEITEDWRKVYRDCNVFITCTVSTVRYIDEPPGPRKLLLNISLRDYLSDSVKDIKAIIVDNWAEVCRENTDIELLKLQHGLTEEGVCKIADVVCRNGLEAFSPDEPVFFNPMGLAGYDIGIAHLYWKEALRKGVGIALGQPE